MAADQQMQAFGFSSSDNGSVGFGVATMDTKPPSGGSLFAIAAEKPATFSFGKSTGDLSTTDGVCATTNENNPFKFPEHSSQVIEKDFCWEPKFPQFTRCRQRLDTYTNWPEFFHVKPNQLAGAGYFYTGIGDHVQCFYCGIIIKSWRSTDNPFEEHIKFSKECGFLEVYQPTNTPSNGFTVSTGGHFGNARPDGCCCTRTGFNFGTPSFESSK